jgi:uncharacterized membrane protein YbhN (UPF0104 family)
MAASDVPLADNLVADTKGAVLVSERGTDMDGSPESGTSRQRGIKWIALASLGVVAAIFVLLPSFRSLPGDTWREIRSVDPIFLVLIIACKIIQALFSALVWRNAIYSAWPRSNLSYRFVLGVDQGQEVVNTVMPGRAGTWGMLGLFALSIPGARFSTMLAVWGVQSLAFSALSLVNYTLIALLLPERTQAGGGLKDRVTGIAGTHPLATAIVLALLSAVLIGLALAGRRKIAGIKRNLAEGFAILRTPGRFLRLIAFPSLVSYAARAASNAALLAAFGIPVTLSTMVLALGSRAAAGAIRFTPGGLGTTQALEVVALRDYASAEVVTAYSLVDLALSTMVSLGIAIPALISTHGWRGTRQLVIAAISPSPGTEPASGDH